MYLTRKINAWMRFRQIETLETGGTYTPNLIEILNRVKWDEAHAVTFYSA